MTSDARDAASGRGRGGRVERPGPRVVYAAVVGVAVVVVAIVLTLGSGGNNGTLVIGGKHVPVTRQYGHTPAWLKIPEPSAPKQEVATASAPQLKAMEGYPVHAELVGGSVQISAEGPSVPGWVSNEDSSGELPEGSKAPSTFDITFDNAHGRVPISPRAFTVITYTGAILHPTVSNAAGGTIPTTVRPGRTLKLKLRTSLPEGDGEIRWAPTGDRILVSYFWTLEFD